MASPDGIAQVMRFLQGAGCKGGPQTDHARRDAIAAWMVALPDVPDGALATAAQLYVREPDGEWWPVPGKLRRFLVSKSNADEAYTYVVAVAARIGMVGATRQLDDDPIEEAAIRAGVAAVGGWASVVNGEVTDWTRKRFVEAYNSTRETRLIAADSLKLLEG